MNYQSYENWNKIIKTLLEKSLRICTTDVNYTREAVYLINKVDSLYLTEPRYILEITDSIESILNSKQYYQNVHKTSDPEEVNLLKQIGEEIIVFRKLLSYEFPNETKKEEVVKERIPNEDISLNDLYKTMNKDRFI